MSSSWILRSRSLRDQRNPNSMKSLGPSAPAASAAWAGHTPGPSLLPGYRPWPRVTNTGKLQVVFFILLLNFLNTVTAGIIGDRPADSRTVEQSLSKGNCSPGYYLPDENGTCKPCRDGIDFTNSFNKWLSCKICSVCKEDKDEKNRCITTRDTECQCKPESFEDENSPEFCQKCSECTNEEDEVTPCTPKTDRKCVPKGSKLSLIIVILVALAVVLIAVYLVGWKTGLWRRVLQYMKGAYPRRERDCEHEQDSDHSRNLLREETSNVGNDSQYSMLTAPPMKWFRSHAGWDFSSQLTKEPEVADSSPVGRKLLVPANGNDSVGALKLIFNQCSNIVPFKSWDSLMRQMGLTDNDIQMVRAVTQVPEDTLYQMLLKWLNQTGRSASINNLLDALEAIGERYARDTIEDHAVKTGEFIYQKTTAEPVMMTHICDTSTEET